MHDIEFIRKNAALFDVEMHRRGLPPQADAILQLDGLARVLTTEEQQNAARRNQISTAMAEVQRVIKRREQDVGQNILEWEQRAEALRSESRVLTTRMGQIIPERRRAEEERQRLLTTLPNILHRDVPMGASEAENAVVATSGEPRALEFEPKEHDALGAQLGMDFKTAARVTGSRFVYLSGHLARLERALGQWMLDTHVERHGFKEVAPPLMVTGDSAFSTGHLPKFEEDLFRVAGDKFLIPTAELPLTAWARDTIMTQDAPLPIRMSALTPCFRSEAGAAGRDTRGMMRQHQFNKVEMVILCRPEQSEEEHEQMTRCAEAILNGLGLTWRRVLLCSGDTGFSSAKTYDLEVWLPGQQAWREISSCSNCTDFQARRGRMAYRDENGKPRLLHTLNGSGVAVGRALVAVLETHQQADGSVMIPAPLVPYMGGTHVLTPE